MSVGVLILFEIPREVKPHEADIAQSATNAVRDKDHKIANEHIASVILGVLRISHN